MAWLSYRTNKAKKAGEGYGNYQDKIVSDNKEVPGIGLAFAPILIILVVNLVLSKMVYPNVDGSYLEESFNSTLAANSVHGAYFLVCWLPSFSLQLLTLAN